MLTIIIVNMMVKQRFRLIYAPQVKQHLRAIERKYHGLIRNKIEALLQFEPGVESRNRKPLKRSVEFEAGGEIRFGPNNRFRVFYEIDKKVREVHILAIGEKQRQRLYVGGEEMEL